MDGSQFDTLVRTLADAQSRRGLLTGALGGVLLGLFGASTDAAKRHGPGHAGKHRQQRRKRERARARRERAPGNDRRAQAQGNSNRGNDECAHFCNAAFPPGPERGKCKSQAAHGEGPCYECGPAATDPAAVACHGKNCGEAVNACGDSVSCGECTPPQTCGGGGAPNVCGGPGCTPTTCAAAGKNCGAIDDGCGETAPCGECRAPETCGGGGQANVCGCRPDNAAACAEKNCGEAVNNCGQTVSCGECTAPETCGGGGTPNVCGSPPPQEFCTRPGFEHLPRCESYPTAEGPSVSVDRCFNCFELASCSASPDCGPGRVCVTDPDDVRCGRNACYPVCGSSGGGICPPNADYCDRSAGAIHFNCSQGGTSSCTCVKKLNGDSFCGTFAGACVPCQSDDECVEVFGYEPGTVCVTVANASDCNCVPGSTRGCVPPCPNPA